MRKVAFGAATALLGCLVIAEPLAAQSKFTISAGGGPVVPGRNSGRFFDTGFNVQAGVGYHPIPYFGVMAEFGFNSMNLSQGALSNVGVPGGSGRIYSLTLNPMVHLMPRDKRLDVYLIGGGGYYRRTVEFTEPSSSIATGFDPYWGVFFPVEVPTTRVLGSYSQNRGGVNGGAGVAIRLRSEGRSTFFAESRYHHIFTSPRRTNYLPVTIGFRF